MVGKKAERRGDLEAKAGKSKGADYKEKKKEGVLYGILVCVLGALWLAQEMGSLRSDLPLGPIAIIIMGFLHILLLINPKN